MTDKIVPLVDARIHSSVPSTLPLHTVAQTLQDSRGRRLHDLRISVTDRCNFRCVYCMPKEVFDNDYAYLPHKDLLNFEEITRLAGLFAQLGVEKFRITGGEPLLRKNLEKLVEMLANIKTPSGQPVDLTLTTNASLLAKKAQSLKDAGLSRITVSLDALDDAIFKKMNDVDYAVADVINGIEAAHAVGLSPIKINMVVKKGWNEDQIVPMAAFFKSTPHIVRFIEYMDVGSSNGWKMDEVLPSQAVVDLISQQVEPLVPTDSNYQGEVAQRWSYADGSNEIGVISSVTQAFCSSCTRARLSTEGKIYTCLFAHRGHDLRALLRPASGQHASDHDLKQAIANVWGERSDRYSEIRTADTVALRQLNKVEMSYIGG